MTNWRDFIPDKKMCPHCKTEKSLGEFYCNDRLQRANSWCKKCENEKNKERKRISTKRGRPRTNPNNYKNWNKYAERKENRPNAEMILNAIGWRKKGNHKGSKYHLWLRDERVLCGRTIDKGGTGIGEYVLEERKIVDCEVCELCKLLYKLEVSER